MRRLSLLLVCLFVITGSACSGDDGGSPSEDSAGQGGAAAATTTTGVVPEGFLIGSVASTTGSAAPYGLSQEQGTQLALSTFGLREARAMSIDDESTEEGGVVAVESVLGANPSVIIGPTLSPVAAAADPLAQQAGVPVLAATNSTLDIATVGDHVWRVSLRDEVLIDQAVAWGTSDGTTAALISQPDNGYSAGAADAFRAAATTHGVELVGDLAYAEGDDVDAVVADAAAGNPDALFLAANGDFAGDLLLAIDANGIDVPRVGGNGFNSLDVLDRVGDAAQGLVVASSWSPQRDNETSRAFIDAYREAHDGEEPDTFAAQGYAAVQIALAAAEAGGGVTAADIQAGLAALGEIDTVLGPFGFDENREPTYAAAVQVFNGDAFSLID